MKALILAAGKGTRLLPVSRDYPKPMLPILHKPVLECLIEQLASHGVTEIIINTSYLAEHIESYFRHGERWGVSIAFSYEGYEADGQLHPTPLGSAGTLRRIQQHSGFFDDTFFVLCGDALIDLDLTAMLAAHHASGATATLALAQVPKQKISQYGVVLQDETGRVCAFQEKPSADEALGDLVNTGVYIFEPSILDWIPDTVPYDLGGQVFPAMAEAGAALYGCHLPFNWIDIGRVYDYFDISLAAVAGLIPAIKPQGREIQPGVRVGSNVRFNPKRCEVNGPIVIADSVTIEDGCFLQGPLWIGRGSVIERGASLSSSLVFDYTRVGSQAMLDRVIASGRWCTTPQGIVIDPQKTGISWVLADSRTPRYQIVQEEQAFLEQAF